MDYEDKDMRSGSDQAVYYNFNLPDHLLINVWTVCRGQDVDLLPSPVMVEVEKYLTARGYVKDGERTAKSTDEMDKIYVTLDGGLVGSLVVPWHLHAEAIFIDQDEDFLEPEDIDWMRRMNVECEEALGAGTHRDIW